MISVNFESKEASEAKWFLNVAQLILSFEHMCDYECGRYKVHILSYACVCDTFDKTPFSKTILTFLSFDIHSLSHVCSILLSVPLLLSLSLYHCRIRSIWWCSHIQQRIFFYRYFLRYITVRCFKRTHDSVFIHKLNGRYVCSLCR